MYTKIPVMLYHDRGILQHKMLSVYADDLLTVIIAAMPAYSMSKLCFMALGAFNDAG